MSRKWAAEERDLLSCHRLLLHTIASSFMKISHLLMEFMLNILMRGDRGLGWLETHWNVAREGRGGRGGENFRVDLQAACSGQPRSTTERNLPHAVGGTLCAETLKTKNMECIFKRMFPTDLSPLLHTA